VSTFGGKAQGVVVWDYKTPHDFSCKNKGPKKGTIGTSIHRVQNSELVWTAFSGYWQLSFNPICLSGERIGKGQIVTLFARFKVCQLKREICNL